MAKEACIRIGGDRAHSYLTDPEVVPGHAGFAKIRCEANGKPVVLSLNPEAAAHLTVALMESIALSQVRSGHPVIDCARDLVKMADARIQIGTEPVGSRRGQ